MAAILNALFRMTDNISDGFLKISNTGRTALSGLEDSCHKVNSAVLQTSQDVRQVDSALLKLSGDTSGMVSQSKLLANAMADEADKMHKTALNAQIKADLSERMAKQARSHYNELEKEIASEKEVTDAMKENAKAALEEAERLEKAAASARKKADSAEKAANAAYDNAKAAMQSAEAEERLYSSATKTAIAEQKVADALNKTEREAKEYGDALRNAADDSRKLGEQGQNVGELLQDSFTALGIVTGIRKIGEAFVSVTNSAIEFESAITGVYKTVDGSEAQLAQISDEVKMMSLEIPSTTTEIAGVAESAGQLGIATENIIDFTEVMINLGEATNLSSDEAASSLAKFSNITGMSASNYENLGSTVVALGNNFATTEADIVAMSTRMASAGTLAGLTESDILGLAASMSSVGIEAEAGGSAMSKLLTDIQVAVETGNESLLDFSSVANMTCEEFTDVFENRAVDALYAFIDGLNDVERNGETATVILENMGITEVRLSNAVKSLANNSEGLADAVDLAGTAWEENNALANEAEKRYGTLESRLTMTKNAANNLKIALGDDLTPVIGEFADKGTEALAWMAGFVEKHPSVTAGLTALSVALGLSAVAITGYNLATNIAIPATQKFTTALNNNPLIKGITIATGVVSLISTFTSVMESNKETVEDYSGTLEQCSLDIENTEAAYANVCKMYGSQSEAAKQLAGELDTLNAQYQKGGGFIADYEQRLIESKEAYTALTTEYESKVNAAEIERNSGFIAVAQLDALSQKMELTNADLDLMSNYADYLNDTFNCNIKVNYDTKELIGFNPETYTDNIVDIAIENRKQAASEFITSDEYTNSYIDSIKKIEALKTEYKLITDEITRSMNSTSAVNTTGYTMKEVDKEYGKLIAEAEKELSNIEADAYEAFSAMGTPELADGFLDNLENVSLEFDKIAESAEEANEVLTYQEAVADVWESNEAAIVSLAEAYEESYNSIRTSLDGMFGIFDEAKMNIEETLSFDEAIAGLESQIDYFYKYEEALSELSEIGLDNNIIEQLNPEQAVAFAQELNNIDSATAKTKVDEINTAFGELSGAKDKTAETMADIEEDIAKKLDEIQGDIEKSIDGMKLDDVAKNAAKVTMDGYIRQLKTSGNRAVSEAESIASKISSALSSISTPSVSVNSSVVYGPQTASSVIKSTKSSPITTVPKSSGSTYGTTIKTDKSANGYAVGTLSAEPGLALVGEKGPELVVMNGGERVYTAEETASIIMRNPELLPTWEHAYAVGTDFAAPGVALVGEKGPELVVMNGGEKVYTASETENILNNHSEIAVPIEERAINNTETVANNYNYGSLTWEHTYAVGTDSAAPGVALVGEKGPELVVMNGGEKVYTASETENILNNHSEIAVPIEERVISNNTETVTSNYNYSSSTWKHAYAVGTDFAAPGVALVGEKGPELVVMNGGEKVYTASETEKILNNYSELAVPIEERVISNNTETSINSQNSSLIKENTLFRESERMHTANENISVVMLNPELLLTMKKFGGHVQESNVLNESLYQTENSIMYPEQSVSIDSGMDENADIYYEKPIHVPPPKTFKTEEYSESSSTSSRRISLDINGSGSINVQGNSNKEEIFEVLVEYMKPVLMSIIEQEIFEEGVSSYEI